MIHGNTTLMEFMTEVLAATESYSHQVRNILVFCQIFFGSPSFICIKI